VIEGEEIRDAGRCETNKEACPELIGMLQCAGRIWRGDKKLLFNYLTQA
jgi:hypothetical protein